MLEKEQVKEEAKRQIHDWKVTIGRLLLELDEAWQCVEDAESEVIALHNKIVLIANEHKLPMGLNSILVKVHKTVPKIHDTNLSGTYNWEFTLKALSGEVRRPSDTVEVELESIPSPIDNAVNDTLMLSNIYENKFGGQQIRDITTIEFDDLEADYNLF